MIQEVASGVKARAMLDEGTVPFQSRLTEKVCPLFGPKKIGITGTSPWSYVTPRPFPMQILLVSFHLDLSRIFVRLYDTYEQWRCPAIIALNLSISTPIDDCCDLWQFLQRQMINQIKSPLKLYMLADYESHYVF